MVGTESATATKSAVVGSENGTPEDENAEGKITDRVDPQDPMAQPPLDRMNSLGRISFALPKMSDEFVEALADEMEKVLAEDRVVNSEAGDTDESDDDAEAGDLPSQEESIGRIVLMLPRFSDEYLHGLEGAMVKQIAKYDAGSTETTEEASTGADAEPTPEEYAEAARYLHGIEFGADSVVTGPATLHKHLINAMEDGLFKIADGLTLVQRARLFRIAWDWKRGETVTLELMLGDVKKATEAAA